MSMTPEQVTEYAGKYVAIAAKDGLDAASTYVNENPVHDDDQAAVEAEVERLQAEDKKEEVEAPVEADHTADTEDA